MILNCGIELEMIGSPQVKKLVIYINKESKFNARKAIFKSAGDCNNKKQYFNALCKLSTIAQCTFHQMLIEMIF